MSWEMIKTLWELIQMLCIYGFLVACGIASVAMAVAVGCWVLNYLRRELGR